MKRTLFGVALASALAFGPACPALAQMTGVFTGTMSPFQPTPAYSQLAVSNVSSRVALPTGSTVVVYNTGASAAYVTLGNSSVTATSAAGDVIPPNSWMAFAVASNAYLAGIASSGATALTISGGTGLPAGAEGDGGSQGPTGSPVPSNAQYAGVVSSGNLVGLIQADSSVAIKVSTATTTQLVPLSGGKKIYVTAYNAFAAGSGAITLEYGTGTNCGTGTTALTGTYNLTAAQSSISTGGGLGPVLVVPAGNALCVLTTAAVPISGSVAYTQF